MEDQIKRWVEEGLPEGLSVSVKREADRNYKISIDIKFGADIILDDMVLGTMNNPDEMIAVLVGQWRHNITHTMAKWLRDHTNCTVREA